jgi:hypothetical protein
MPKMKPPSDEKIAKYMRTILETSFWPSQLSPKETYFRTQDDCDGDLSNGMSVTFSEDGDAWIDTFRNCCRFRTHGGGGRSLRVRNALILLAIAIQLDNKEFPYGNHKEKAQN